MYKKALFGIFATLIFIVSALGCFAIVRTANAKRVSLSNYYQNTANTTADSREKALFLIKSDALAPTAEKKVFIALLLLDQNQPAKAEYYLKFAPNSEGDLLLTQYYLLNQPALADKYLSKINGSVQKTELNQFKAIVDGKKDISDIPTKPQTDLGKLLLALNIQDYSILDHLPLIKPLNQKINKNDNPNTQSLSVANYFISDNQPYLALFTLNTLENKIGETPIIYAKKAEVYADISDYKEAVVQITNAIKLKPEDISLYTVGVEYATKANNNAKMSFWSERIKELQVLQK